ncbi:phytanoyl-CoA dioxygenase family protein [Amylibacter sp.]|jgi:ectoine hydroxylase-related dioxygenase (phytanoyl-CoA dioxygenase family)|nr:phytanoyl-CoA dioxygenase family protein [Amylibacter sp.]MDA9926828.1 phytanoyl-CoA dioxygenase family protein [Amylibacter sp.]MDB2337243.1 phytanoyl-CoA dioxygenase family protein [Amylibacter sp.]MDB4079395.1 phytanoyl-CoA dioxygenase family protein [Amylibacter sp.]|tara:strand:+ start:2654 stop:3796 length:1143 start_codon:yes stop_codon:yes gene_type:complete
MQGYLSSNDCNLEEFSKSLDHTLNQSDVPLAHDIKKNIPIYDVSQIDFLDNTQTLRTEWANVLHKTAGVLVLKNAYPDTSCIDAATLIFEKIIADEKAATGDKADHFAASGANDRIWNSAQKLCQSDPDTFAKYFSNLAVDTACKAWLGPNYQMTAQINLVRPTGAAQSPHRDYHLGFQTRELAESYPAHVHDLSPVLTLQGAIAHIDMPIESGPTKLLPFSQIYRHGYLAYSQPEFREYFENNYVQIPLNKGDVLFFNPALYHAGGANISKDIHRMANLLQVSSAFGRAMESLDRSGMTRKLYPILAKNNHNLSEKEIDAAITSCAEGYSFPTNLDTAPPLDGLAPETQANLFRRALTEKMSISDFEKELSLHDKNRRA